LVEALLWMARVGAPWRDLTEAFGSWNTILRRFRRMAARSDKTDQSSAAMIHLAASVMA
jgi:transposase